jgi:quercetin dioxygenase-like cupin family protein
VGRIRTWCRKDFPLRVFTLGRSLLLGALIVSGVANAVSAQDEMPPGVSLEVFANGIAAEVPQEADQILLVELSMQAGSTLPLEPDAQTVSLVAMREGELSGKLDTAVEIGRADAEPGQTEQAAAGTEFTLEAGDSALIPAGAVGEMTSGEKPLSALLLVAAPAAADNGTAGVAPDGVTFTPLAAGDTPELDEGALFWLGQFTLQPGASFPGQAQPGVELGAGTAGEFTMKSTGGPGVVVLRDFTHSVSAGEQPAVAEAATGDILTFGAGDAVYFPDGNTVDISNAGSAEAVTLFGGVGPLPAE